MLSLIETTHLTSVFMKRKTIWLKKKSNEDGEPLDAWGMCKENKAKYKPHSVLIITIQIHTHTHEEHFSLDSSQRVEHTCVRYTCTIHTPLPSELRE
mmetsp:Transcript_67838/g.78853  ORF Transcript_67838/g.78853 Transcript_67838/m.78853 type:complete len:97 (-) Transcript_67838:425-715(-)